MEKGEAACLFIWFICKRGYVSLKNFTSILLYILLLAVTATAQVQLNKDSLLRLLPQIKDDTAGAEFYIALGQQFENNEPERAKAYYRKARDISQAIGYTAGVIRYINNYTYVLNLQGQYDSSLLLNLQGVEMARNTNDSLNLAKTLVNSGTSFRYLGRYEDAIRHYEEGKRIFERLGDPFYSAQLGDILALLYIDMRQYDKAILSGKKAADYFRKTNNPLLLSVALNNLGIAYAKKLQLADALACFKETLRLGEQLGDSSIIVSGLLNVGDIYLKQGRYAQMEPYFRKALLLNQRIGSQATSAIVNRALALVEMSKKNYTPAKNYALQSLEIARKNHLREEEKKALETLANLHYALQDMPMAESYLQQATLLADSMLNETVARNALEIEKRFESEKKDFTIKQLEAEREVQHLAMRQKTILNTVLIVGFILLLFIAGLLYRNYKHQQRLQQQRISELEKEKQLAATEAVLKGEEQERTRLAKDLHDGLGGMLSGIKYTMNAMKGNLIMTPENAQAFERSMDMLDSSIQEMRRVAHNLMPEALVKFGLDTALRDFCNEINQAGALQVSYQSIGLTPEAVTQTTAITVYRIVQELLNNVLKHAVARQALVQVSLIEGNLSITVEDDGKGFDTATVAAPASGMGLSNIRSRVEYLRGKMDVQSAPGKGTSVHIVCTV